MKCLEGKGKVYFFLYLVISEEKIICFVIYIVMLGENSSRV